MAEYAYSCPYFSDSINKGEVVGLALTNAEVEIPYLAQNYHRKTKILISNPGEAATAASLSYRDRAGLMADDEYPFELKLHGSTVIDLGALETPWNLESAVGGHLFFLGPEWSEITSRATAFMKGILSR
ncbi:MAG: hypothetical protein JXR89_09980 [Deltaproteobacteria bacterium]|nr:hypothetical protein [Deltaproteobacteria bacterium]